MSQEVSEESSVTVTSAACGCQHDPGCAIGAIGGQLPAGENNNSVEVRDRLKELQGRTSMLEQEKARGNAIVCGVCHVQQYTLRTKAGMEGRGRVSSVVAALTCCLPARVFLFFLRCARGERAGCWVWRKTVDRWVSCILYPQPSLVCVWSCFSRVWLIQEPDTCLRSRHYYQNFGYRNTSPNTNYTVIALPRARELNYAVPLPFPLPRSPPAATQKKYTNLQKTKNTYAG